MNGSVEKPIRGPGEVESFLGSYSDSTKYYKKNVSFEKLLGEQRGRSKENDGGRAPLLAGSPKTEGEEWGTWRFRFGKEQEQKKRECL